MIELVKEVEILHKSGEKVSEDLAFLFEGELNPIAQKAQRKVPIPDGYVILFSDL